MRSGSVVCRRGGMLQPPMPQANADPVLRQAELLHRGGASGTWGNLGLWRSSSDDYATACRALAIEVGNAARIAARDRVLSIACGAGDELVVWVDDFGAAQASGIEIDHACTAATLAALPCVLPAHFDQILCVDAAYHLAPRQAFIDAAFGLLRPGGRLAYTDLVVDRDRGVARIGAPLLGAAARLCGVPAADLGPAQKSVARLAAAGWVDIESNRLDDAVLGGFTRFVRSQGRRLGGAVWSTGWRRPRTTAGLIPLCRAAGLGYALFAATKPGPPTQQILQLKPAT